MNFTVEYEQEEDGRWLAEVKELPLVVAQLTLMWQSIHHSGAGQRRAKFVDLMPKTNSEKLLELRSKMKKSKKDTEDVLSELGR